MLCCMILLKGLSVIIISNYAYYVYYAYHSTSTNAFAFVGTKIASASTELFIFNLHKKNQLERTINVHLDKKDDKK